MLTGTPSIAPHAATRNACKLCTPLGACLAFKGIRGGMPLLHGSQGCSTYIRRYLISHFREPVDIACSNFAEETAIFGGGLNMQVSLENICKQYRPEFIGISTTCLSETIGDDVPMFLKEFKVNNTEENLPPIAHISTPSYRGTHIDGFHGAVRSTVAAIADRAEETCNHINLFPGMISPADLRYLKEIMADFGLPVVMLPDYSETLDGGPWRKYHRIPEGGTPVESIRKMGAAKASIEFGHILAQLDSAGMLLRQKFDVPLFRLGLPIGIRETDCFIAALEAATDNSVPEKYVKERGRLIDSYTDGHKYVSGVTAAVYGEEDLVIGLASFLGEIGIIPVICASGSKSEHFRKNIAQAIPDFDRKNIKILSGSDFIDIAEAASDIRPDLLIGHSKGYSVARQLDIPLIRAGFPIHDRVGGARIHHLGYRGAQELFDRIVNALMEKRQTDSGLGYSYM